MNRIFIKHLNVIKYNCIVLDADFAIAFTQVNSETPIRFIPRSPFHSTLRALFFILTS